MSAPWVPFGALPRAPERGCRWRCRLCGDNSIADDPVAAIWEHWDVHTKHPSDWFATAPDAPPSGVLIVTYWDTLFRMARAVGKARKSGADPVVIAAAEARLKSYEREVLASDHMVIPTLTLPPLKES